MSERPPQEVSEQTREAVERELAAVQAEQERRLLATQREIERRAALRSLAEFVRQAWHVLEPGTPLAWGWHIEAICLHLEAVFRGEINRLLINVPPGHMKSLLTNVFFPAWAWLHRPSWRLIYATYAQDLTERDSVKCRDLIKSQWYQETFRPAWKIKADQDTKDHIANTEGGFRIALSVGGKGTGYRGDATIADDPISAEEAYSEAARKRCIRWWDKTMSSRLSNPKLGVRVIIMQRLHQEDLSGHVLRKGGYQHLKLASEFDPKKKAVTFVRRPDPETGKYRYEKFWEDPRQKLGEPLFPALFDEEVLEQCKKDLADAYAGQHLQEPTAAEGGLFKKKWWRFHRPDGLPNWGTAERPDGCNEHPAIPLPRMDRFLISLDANFKEGLKNSYVVFTVWGARGADRFLLEVRRGQWGFTKTLEVFRELVQAWPLALEKIVEEKANGAAIINTLSSEIAGIIPIDPEGGKEARAAAIQPQVRSGNVYLAEGADWLEEYVAEMASFPNGMFNDQVDSTSQALIYLGASPDITAALAMGKD
jgi:predicted phage terminase large subunit-like protein